jgi:hypothetical protein
LCKQKKLKLASYTNVTINRVEGAYTVLPRTYMKIITLSMSGRDNYEQNVNSDVRENAHTSTLFMVTFVYEANFNFFLRYHILKQMYDVDVIYTVKINVSI